MTEPQRLDMTNICLAAALLALVPGSSLVRISPSPSVDGKRIFTLAYPANQEPAVKQVIEEFSQRRLVVDLYAYNKTLNALRDQLHQTTGERGQYEHRSGTRCSSGLSEARA